MSMDEIICEDLLQRMRSHVQACLPDRAFLRRDRGDCLFITNAPVFAPEIEGVPRFIEFSEGALMRLLPDVSWIRCCENAPPADHLSASLERFRGHEIDIDGLKLFAQGAKLLENNPSVGEIHRFDQALRQRSALALRGACFGGGLYVCALLNAYLHRPSL